MSGVGIGNLPNQKHRKVTKRGAHLNMMVVGESGLGKTTFVNTLFNTSLCDHKDLSKRTSKSEKGETTKIKITEAELEEKGFKLKLTVVDTPGFGDFVNNNECWNPVVDFIDTQYNLYLTQEMQPERTLSTDTRIHVCLYFIYPSGHSLKTLDIIAMKEIGKRVNLVPVIAKADTLTAEEIKNFKERVKEEISSHDIQIYRCPIESEDEESTNKNKEIASAIPFSIIGSEEMVTVGDKQVRARPYPWGIAEVENEKHCDFKKLRNLLLRMHLLDLIVSTEDVHYENFRDKQLEKGGLSAGMTPEKLKKDLEIKMQKQEEQMRKKFTDQVKQEEEKFKKWDDKISSDKERFQAELDQKRTEIQKLQEEVNALQARVSANTKKK